MREPVRGDGPGGVWPGPSAGGDRVIAAHPSEEGDARVEIVVVPGAGVPRLELRLPCRSSSGAGAA
jgi:hypothetical protein